MIMTRFVYADANVRVDTPNSLYGDTPFTQKGGGGGRCGEQGDYIQVNSILFFSRRFFCVFSLKGDGAVFTECQKFMDFENFGAPR